MGLTWVVGEKWGIESKLENKCASDIFRQWKRVAERAEQEILATVSLCFGEVMMCIVQLHAHWRVIDTENLSRQGFAICEDWELIVLFAFKYEL